FATSAPVDQEALQADQESKGMVHLVAIARMAMVHHVRQIKKAADRNVTRTRRNPLTKPDSLLAFNGMQHGKAVWPKRSGLADPFCSFLVLHIVPACRAFGDPASKTWTGVSCPVRKSL